MTRQFNHVWRLAMTGLAFAAMGVGGMVLAVAVFPPITWFTRDPVLRQRRVQQAVRASFQVYIAMLQILGLLSLRVAEADRLRGLQGHLVVANHPTLLDIVLLMALIPRAQCIVKHQLWRNVFLRPVVQGAGYIRNDQDAEHLLASCAATLRAGNNLIVFPEGTRSRPGQPITFRRGFANIALVARTDIEAVIISCTPPTLAKGDKWYSIPLEKPTFSIDASEPIDINNFLSMPHRSLAARRLHATLEHRYAEALRDGKSGARDQKFDCPGAEARGLVA